MSTQSNAIVDKLLTNVSNKLVPTGYISEMVLPMIQVAQTSGKLGTYGNNHLRILNTVTGGKGQYPTVSTSNRSSVIYNIERHALKDFVTDEDYRNVEKPFDAEKDVVDDLTTMLWTGKEKSLADTLGDVAIITQNETLAGTSQFSDYTSSDPNLKFKNARVAVRGGCGFAPNTAIMDWDVAETLRFHPGLLDTLGYKDSRPGGLNDMELARALNVKRVLIAESVYNNGKEGQADIILPIWGKNLVFAYIPERASIKQQSLGYRLQLSGESPRQVYKVNQDEPVNSKKVMVIDSYEQLGYLTDKFIAFYCYDFENDLYVIEGYKKSNALQDKTP